MASHRCFTGKKGHNDNLMPIIVETICFVYSKSASSLLCSRGKSSTFHPWLLGRRRKGKKQGINNEASKDKVLRRVN